LLSLEIYIEREREGERERGREGERERGREEERERGREGERASESERERDTHTQTDTLIEVLVEKARACMTVPVDAPVLQPRYILFCAT
jgi:hypothetical protein